MTAKQIASNIRADLRASFTGQKFSVTTNRGGQFDAITINWVGGPDRDTVESVAAIHATENTFVFFQNN